MRISRSVGAQLFAALVAVVSIALATTYLMVVPTLERRLVSNKLDELERSARPVATRVADTESPALRSYVEEAASAVDARVVVFDVIGRPLQLLPQADSLRTGTAAIAKDRIALEAMKTARTIRGTVSRGSGRHAEVAEFVPGTNRVILLSSPLGDTRRSVASVRGQLLIAALPSLLIALAIGLIGARTLTSRIRRLERAANRIAAGSLDDPVEEEGADEVGQLAHPQLKNYPISLRSHLALQKHSLVA